jgi:CRP/FNR family transcriptional regulator, cyclic AMP receptor protein
MVWQIIGYVGSVLMFSTFYMKTMLPLRVTAMAANVIMIIFAAATAVYPLLILHAMSLPLNGWRFLQVKRLLKSVRAASRGSFKVETLIPFMQAEQKQAGDVLFRTGDHSEKMYMIHSGRVLLKEVDVVLGPGDVFGEIGLLSPTNTRMATAVCTEDSKLYGVTQDHIVRLYYQNPEFAFYLIKLVTRRLLHNLQQAEFDATATLSPGTKLTVPKPPGATGGSP